ncbi:MAG TPA: nucleotidyltransferase family protein, partial [Roseimicrobium sp.]|nr:nucleotidyltransferase family protein [Roseimicrobium sp.]
DILVWPGDLERAVGLLCRHGYSCPDPVPGLHSRNMERQSPGILVELHERVAQAHFSIPLTDASLWKDSGTVRIVGGAVPVASPEMNLLLLCLHGAKHVWQRLSWVCDVLLFVRAHPHLDWDRFLTLAKECRSVRIAHSALLLANEVRGGCVPASVLSSAASDSGAVSLARKAARWLFLPKASYRVSIQKYWFLVCMRDSVRDRLPVMRHLLGMALKPREEDRKAVRLPQSLAFLYYVVRPFRLIRKLMVAR